jgi:hypothetical protein
MGFSGKGNRAANPSLQQRGPLGFLPQRRIDFGFELPLRLFFAGMRLPAR